MNQKRVKSYLVLTIAGLTLLIIAIVGLNLSSVNNKDVEAIKDVLIKAETIADKAYIDAKELEKTDAIDGQTRKTYTLEEQEAKKAIKDNLIKIYTNEINNVFSEKANLMKKKWIDTQISNVIDGPDCIDCGISKIDIKDISVNNKTATVTAVLTKYLIDQVTLDEKIYHDKMEGEVLVKAKLIKVGDRWLIDEYSSDPQYGDVNHTLTEEK